VDTSKEETKKTALHIIRQADENRWKLCNLSRFHAVVVSFEDGKRLRESLNLIKVDISGIGQQYVNRRSILALEAADHIVYDDEL